MTPSEFLSYAHQHNVVLTVHEGALTAKARMNVWTDEAKEALHLHKQELITLLIAKERRACRRKEAEKCWPELLAAIDANTLPEIPYFFCYDVNGGRWECANLAEYSRIAIADLENGEEDMAISMFRLDLCANALAHSFKAI